MTIKTKKKWEKRAMMYSMCFSDASKKKNYQTA